MLGAAREHQHGSLGTRVLHRRAHQHVDRCFENDLARYRLRDLDHCRKVEQFARGANRARGMGWLSILPRDLLTLVELAYLAIGSPAQIAVPCIPQIHARNLAQAPLLVEMRGGFVGHALVLQESVLARQADAFLVQVLRLAVSTLQPRYLG